MVAFPNILGWIAFLVPVCALGACGTSVLPPLQATPTSAAPLVLPFETISQWHWGRGEGYEGEKPDAFIISDPSDIQEVKDWITADAKSTLEGLDYQTFFAIAAFQGYKTIGPFEITIDAITKQNDDLVVQVTLKEPCYNCPRTPAATSPYHLVRVKKQGEWNRNIHLYLAQGNEKVLVESHRIP